jgi:AtzE family amidohydrolase
MKLSYPSTDALSIAGAVKSRQVSATQVVSLALEVIGEHDEVLNSFTAVIGDNAKRQAASIDARIAAGEDPGPLAGVPFAVKNLFDMEGLTTVAGSRIHASKPPATRDAAAVRALKAAGAILVGALNMDEYAYGFSTENTHYGATRNPHDLNRVAGGSSGGSAAAVAGGLVPLSLGSDTNGSIRVPAAFCGIFGLKPTYGRVSRAGAFLFAGSLDQVGPLARSVRDLAASFDCLQGPDDDDPVCTKRPAEPTLPFLEKGRQGLRIALADDYFARQADPDNLEAASSIAKALGAVQSVTIPEAARARAAAYIITASEGGNMHLPDLRTRAAEFDPLTRNRFLAGTLIPGAWYSFAQRFRTWYRDRVRELFRHVDVIVAPATPCAAIELGEDTIVVDGKTIPSRANIGIFTQPISFIGLPVVVVPIQREGKPPLGVQLIGAPYREADLLRAAWYLERDGIVSGRVAQMGAIPVSI